MDHLFAQRNICSAQLSSYCRSPSDDVPFCSILFHGILFHIILSHSIVFHGLQVCDRVARSGGFRVVIADLLGDNVWPANNYPPVSQSKQGFMDWYRKGPGSWPVNKDKLVSLIQHLTEQPADTKKLAVIGFGWGAYMALNCGCGSMPAAVKAVGALSPIFFGFDEDLAAALQVPVAIYPSKLDPMDKIQLIVAGQKPDLFQNCDFKRFGKVVTGFCSYAVPFHDVKLLDKSTQAVDRMVDFLTQQLKQTST